MPTTNVDALYGGSARTWANTLAARITSGEYESLAAGWISNINTAPLSGTSVSTGWASEANAYDCTVVFNFQTGQDLCTSSYFNAIPVARFLFLPPDVDAFTQNAIIQIELQITKQVYRLAAWLNTIFD
ncbi:hypothetical protein V8E53_006712 [Lactarius tabidus]